MNSKFLRVISLLNGLVFFAPVALLVRTSRGLSVSQFFMLQVVLSAGIFIFEIPLGYVTDKIGYKKSLVLSQCLLFGARVLLWLAGSFEVFLLEAVIEALACCFSSGTIEAYLYRINAGEYGEERAKNSNFGTLGFIASTLLYSPLYVLGGIELLLAATAVCSFLAMIFSFFLEDVKPDIKKMTEKSKGLGVFFGGLRGNLRAMRWLNKIGVFTLFKSVGSISLFVVNFFYIIKIQQLGIPDAWMSAVIMAYSAVELVVPRMISFLKRKGSMRMALGMLWVILAGLFVYLSLGSSMITLAAMIIIPAVVSASGILLSELENRYIDQIHQNDRRATLISVSSMGQNLLDMIFLLLANALSGIGIGIPFALVGVGYVITLLLNRVLPVATGTEKIPVSPAGE